jgi:hypothetical protein
MNLQRFELETQLGSMVQFVGDMSCPRYTEFMYLVGEIVEYHYNDEDKLLSCDVRIANQLIKNVNHTEIEFPDNAIAGDVEFWNRHREWLHSKGM